MSFIAASFVTNVAFSSLRQVGIELLEHDENLSLSGLHQMCCSFDRTAEQETLGDRRNNHSLLDHLQQTEQSLFHYRDGHQSIVLPSCGSCIQRSTAHHQSLDMDDDDNLLPFSEAIIQNIFRLVSDTYVPTSVVRNGTPVYADVGYLLTRANEQTISWSAVLGLRTLVYGYRAYLQSTEFVKSVSKCRISALRMAKQASSHVSSILKDTTCFPCRCTQTFAFHLQHL